MKKIASVLIIIISIQFFSCQSKNEEITIFMSRHAEKDLTVEGNNPPLTSEGEARAKKLSRMMAEEKLTAVFTTGLERTINTVKGSAEQAGLEIQYYEYHDFQSTLDEIKAGKHGNKILIGGHGDNLLPMIEYFDIKKPLDSLGHHEYDKLFKIKLSAKDKTVETIIY